MSNNPFYSATLHNRSNCDVEFRPAPEEGEIPDQTPVLLKNGRYGILIIQPQDDKRHAVLGRFMDAWSNVEMQLARLLGLAVNLHPLDTPVLMNGLGTRGQRDAIEALLVPRLRPEAAERLTAALASVKSNATKRNYIVHGFWALEIVIADRNGVPWPNYRQFRRYDPSNEGLRKEMDTRAPSSARNTYMFSLARIIGITKSLDRLWHDLASVTKEDVQIKKQTIDVTIDTAAPFAWVRP